MAARTLKLHPCAPELTDNRRNDKERDISEVEMREHPCKKNEGYRDMDIKEPFEGIPFRSFTEITKGEVDKYGKCEK
jgi:hypothetical protein